MVQHPTKESYRCLDGYQRQTRERETLKALTIQNWKSRPQGRWNFLCLVWRHKFNLHRGILGYCAEGKYRLLFYEYMEHGSLAKELYSMYKIPVGTAKGLAYLHEECLEWVLDCDVKPHNVLLDSNYQPKVADFELSKLLNRGNREIKLFEDKRD